MHRCARAPRSGGCNPAGRAQSLVFGAGAFLEPRAESRHPAAAVPEPRRQRPRHPVPLPGQQHEAGYPAHHERQREQQQPARPDQVQQDDRDDEQQDPRGRVGECGTHDHHSIVNPSGSVGRQQLRVDVAAGEHRDRRPGRRKLAGVEQPRRHRGRSARLGDQPGLAREPPDRGQHLLLGHRDDVGHQLADVRERQRADLLDPQRVRDRALDVGRGPRDPLAAAQGVAGVRGEFGFDADHGRPGQAARTAAAMPEISPPPLTGTTTRSACGQSAAISRPTVPCPAMTSRSSNGGMSTYPCLATSSSVAATRAASVGLHGHQLGAVALDRLGLDLRRRPRHHHDRAHAEQGRGVGHRVTVVPAGMSDDPALPGGLPRWP